jgi:hypothetical protein
LVQGAGVVAGISDFPALSYQNEQAAVEAGNKKFFERMVKGWENVFCRI